MALMSAPATSLEEAIQAALATVDDPEIHRPITDLGMVRAVSVSPAGAVTVDLLLTVVGCPLKDKLRTDITAAVTAMGYACPEIDMVWMLQEEGRAKR